MTQLVSSVQARASTAPPRFSFKQLRRLMMLIAENRGRLLLGMLATIVFAGLHTVSIGAAYPVFRVLLEQEGLHGWVDRTVAAKRTGMTLNQPSEDGSILVTKVSTESAAYKGGLRAGAVLLPGPNESTASMLREIANAQKGDTVRLRARMNSQEANYQFVIDRSAGKWKWLQWGASLLSADVDQRRLQTLTSLLMGLVGLVFVANIFRYLGEVLMAHAVLEAMLKLRGALYERTLHLPMTFFAGQSTADIVGRFVQDIQEIQRGMLILFSKFTREPLRAVFVLGLAFTLDWRMTLTILILAPVTGVLFWQVGRRVKKSNRKLLQGYGEMIGALTASLQSLRVVKAYTAEERERQRLERVDRKVLHQQLKLAKLQAFINPAMETVIVIAASMLTLWLASRVLRHEMNVSTFATLGLALSMAFDPLRKLTDVYIRVQRSTAGAERIFQVLDHPVESEATSGDGEIAPLREKIEFRDVSFTYPGAEENALRQVTLEIARGETVALVGPNGCGKTTLVSMIPRLLSPDEGCVLFDGVDLATCTLPSLRRQIGLVTQDAVVFEGTPIDNIAYGQPVADESAVREAARRASAEEFIDKIPGGFSSILAERGTSLSGGQRQRLAIARAILRDAPILIFDEATSQVDSESEWKIRQALEDFSKDRTTIIIAHRLSTIQFADRIVVMDGGRVIDMGSQQELFERCRLFRTLCETQLLDAPNTCSNGTDASVNASNRTS